MIVKKRYFWFQRVGVNAVIECLLEDYCLDEFMLFFDERTILRKIKEVLDERIETGLVYDHLEDVIEILSEPGKSDFCLMCATTEDIYQTLKRIELYA
jgi:hypothetical protein